MRTLVLGLGNDLAGDDAVGVLAARALATLLEDRDDVVVLDTAASGMALLDVLAGYERAVLVDAIATGERPVGAIARFELAEVGHVVAPSLHQAGLAEVAAMAERLGLSFPASTVVFAVEVADPFTVGAPIGEAVVRAIDDVVRLVLAQLRAWRVITVRPV
ncbi:MAG: hydrogenase maturation protease [Actinomycetota bacterium]